MSLHDTSFAADTSARSDATLWQNEISKSIGARETVSSEKLQLTSLMAAKIAGTSPRALDQHSILRVVETTFEKYANMQTIIADEARIANKGQYFLTGTHRDSPIYQQRLKAAAAQIAVDEALFDSYQTATDLQRSRMLNDYSRISFSSDQIASAKAVGAAYLLGLYSMFPAAGPSAVERHDRNAFEQENTTEETTKGIKIKTEGAQKGKPEEEKMKQEAMQKREEFMQAAFEEWKKHKEQERRQAVVAQNTRLTQNAMKANWWIGGSIGAGIGALAGVTVTATFFS